MERWMRECFRELRALLFFHEEFLRFPAEWPVCHPLHQLAAQAEFGTLQESFVNLISADFSVSDVEVNASFTIDH